MNIAPNSTADCVINSVAYDRDGRVIRMTTLDEISDILEAHEGFVWLGMLEPGQDLLAKIQEEFSLHDLAIEDAHRAHQRPKVEQYGDSLFIVLKTAQFQDGKVAFGETHLFFGKEFLVSVRHGASAPYTSVRAHCEAKPELLAQGSAYALYALMDFVIDNYSPVVEVFEEALASLEHDIFSGRYTRDTIRRLYQFKRQLVELRSAVVPMIEIANALTRTSNELIPEIGKPYFRDLSDHATRINEAIDMMREMLTAALDVNVSLISIGQNEVVKKLAGWAAIIAVPTLVVSSYGMNFEHMPELKWRYGYPLVMLLTFLASAFLYWRFRKRRWL